MKSKSYIQAVRQVKTGKLRRDKTKRPAPRDHLTLLPRRRGEADPGQGEPELSRGPGKLGPPLSKRGLSTTAAWVLPAWKGLGPGRGQKQLHCREDTILLPDCPSTGWHGVEGSLP